MSPGKAPSPQDAPPPRSPGQPERPLFRHARTCSTAVRFRFGGQSAWLGFNWVSRGSTGSGLGSTPGVPSLSIVMPGLVPGISAGAIAEAEVDARNKSGHDGRACRKGRSSMMERDRTEGLRAPVRLRPTAEPDSRGLVPGISLHRFYRAAAWMPGTSPGMTIWGHDGKRVGVPGVGPGFDATGPFRTPSTPGQPLAYSKVS